MANCKQRLGHLLNFVLYALTIWLWHRFCLGQKSRCLAQDFITTFEFVILAFERLDAGVLRLLGYDSGFFAS